MLTRCLHAFLHLPPPAQPQASFAKAAAAAFTAAALLASPVFAAEPDVKSVVCASNPTAKVRTRRGAWRPALRCGSSCANPRVLVRPCVIWLLLTLLQCCVLCAVWLHHPRRSA